MFWNKKKIIEFDNEDTKILRLPIKKPKKLCKMKNKFHQ